MKVLLIDDSALMRKMVSKTLRQADIGNIETVEADNGQQGLDVHAAEKPDVILCDWNMPVMDGLQFVTQLRTKSQTAVIMLTTEAGPERVASALRAGADGYVTKPFTAEKLAEAIKTALAGKGRAVA